MSDSLELGPLDMARNLVRSVEAVARYVEDGGPEAEIQAHIRGLGPRQHQAAELAGQLALVSIAEDVRRIADKLAPRPLASCGHLADEDGECSCSSWPERARDLG